MKVKAIYNACIVKPIEAEEETYGNIIVPDMGKDTNTFGEVISVGLGNFSFSGVRIPTQLKVGDKVVLPTQGFTKLPYNGEEYLVGPENQVLAVIESEVDLNEVVASTELTEEDKSNLTQIS
jgi:co-chaperonin GroES (HSP10)|tara:strand:- start:2151 stop:2516 length:366 start_codon:yes stop_codon:yes gene_type:complete